MNTSVTPSITAGDPAEYQRQMERVSAFAPRVHIDIADGTMSPVHLTSIDEIWWPGTVRADIHVMYKRPLEHLPALIALQPQLIIVHAEGEGSYFEFAEACHHHGIETGIALLQTTPVEQIKGGLDLIDHVLVFSGDLGHFGGKANPALLSKVKLLKQLKPQLEIGWDGGVNLQNAAALAKAGVEVLNTGGYIQQADDPQSAYEELMAKANSFASAPAPTAPASAPSPATEAQASAPEVAEPQAPTEHHDLPMSRPISVLTSRTADRGRGATGIPVRRLNVEQR
jgi:ribulose-phosphate 3-epimerase